MCMICHADVGTGATTRIGPRFRLGDQVVPRHYDLRLEPNCDNNATFKGSVAITLDIRSPTNAVTLHARDLLITKGRIVSASGTQLNARSQLLMSNTPLGKRGYISAATHDADLQFATCKFDGLLSPGEWTLVLEFEGSLVQPSLQGFYRSEWTDAGGAAHWLFSTQFQDTHARRAFPCFDEPAFKATFDVSLVLPEQLTALSNGRMIDEQSLGNGKKLVRFATTPRQSTYLVAFAVGDLESSRSVSVNGVEIRIWSVPGKNHLKEFALRCAQFGLRWFEEKLGIKYFGGDKLDLIAIPAFSFGAMENTGLITFREVLLLVDESQAKLADLKQLAMVIFHELAHQWFGNLVTMLWWDGLPLNESNATFFGYLVLAAFMPELKGLEDFARKRSGAFVLDALQTTHPCWTAIGHPSEVAQIFDDITYYKGGALELWLLNALGPDAFLQGMKIYLERFQYGNAVITDLWDALEEGARRSGSHLPVRQIMDDWFLTSGHPLVTVDAGARAGHIHLTQEHFCSSGEADLGRTWPIMLKLRYVTAAGVVQEKSLLFGEREAEIDLGGEFRFVVANAGGDGFFRVRYTPAMLSRLTQKGAINSLSVVERYNLVNDCWALTKAQKIEAGDFLELMGCFKGERSPIVWAPLSEALSTLHTFTTGAGREHFEHCVRSLARPIFNELSWDRQQGDQPEVLELRGSLITLLGTVGGDVDIQERAQSIFDFWTRDRSAVDGDVAAAALAVTAHVGDGARFDEFIAFSRQSATAQEKLRFLSALGDFRDEQLIARAIKMMLEEVKVDDAPSLLSGFLSSETAGLITWRAIVDNWDFIVRKFPPARVVRMVESCSALDSVEAAAQVRDFFARTKVEEGEHAVARMLESLTNNEAFRARVTPALSARFA